MFWFFGHPEVYIIALPFFGIISEVVPVFSRKPIFGYTALVYATLSIGALSIAVWAHHLYATGAVLLPFFSFHDIFDRRPDWHQVLSNWIGTMWKGQFDVRKPRCCSRWASWSPSCWAGSRVLLLASPPIDFHVTDTYFRRGALPLRAVRHHRVSPRSPESTSGFPKMTGRLLDRTPGNTALLVDVHRLSHHVLGPALAGRKGHAAPLRRLLPTDGFTTLKHRFDGRCVHSGVSDVPVRVERLQKLALR